MNHATDDRLPTPVPWANSGRFDEPRKVLVCQHTTCMKDGAAAVMQALQAQPLSNVEIVASSCMGNCGNGPMVMVLPDQVSYSHVRSRDVAAIVAHHSPPQLGRSPDHHAPPQESSLPKRQNHDNRHQPPSSTVGFWPYVALGLALLVALGSILGTALSLT